MEGEQAPKEGAAPQPQAAQAQEGEPQEGAAEAAPKEKKESPVIDNGKWELKIIVND